MKGHILIAAILVFVASLLPSTNGVPPDFFRNGRPAPPEVKKSMTEYQLVVEVACEYCRKYLIFKEDCLQNVDDKGRLCLQAYSGEIKNALTKRGWA